MSLVGRSVVRGVRVMVVVLLAGCAESPGRTAPETASGPPSLDWATALDGDAVLLTVSDRSNYYRVERATLTGPAGRRIEAEEVLRGASAGGAGGPRVSTGVGVGSRGSSRVGVGVGSGGVGVGIGGGSGGAGIGFRLPTIGSGRSTERSIETRIVFRLPDRQAYLRQASQWRISLELADAEGNPVGAEIPAPTGQ